MNNIPQEVVRKKFWEIWEETQDDEEYARLYREMDILEPRYEAAIAELPDEVEDLIRDYVNQCEAMSHRMLECACAEILHLTKELA